MKKFSIPFLALLVTIAFSAFKAPQHKQLKGTLLYTYQFNGTAIAGENTAANYTKATSSQGCSELEDDMVCFIQTTYAPDVNNHPVFPSGENVRTDANVTIEQWEPQP